MAKLSLLKEYILQRIKPTAIETVLPDRMEPSQRMPS